MDNAGNHVCDQNAMTPTSPAPRECLAMLEGRTELGLESQLLHGWYYPIDLAEGAGVLALWDEYGRQAIYVPVSVVKWLVVVR